MDKKIYVVTAKISKNVDVLYYVFSDKNYFNAFVDCVEYEKDGDYDEMYETVSALQEEKGMFQNMSEEMLEYIGDYDLNEIFSNTYELASSAAEFKRLSDGCEIVSEANVSMF